MISGDAQRILNDPGFKEVLDYMEGRIVQQMKKAPLKDLDTHHELVLSLQVMENVRKVLESWAQDSKVAEFNTMQKKRVV